MEHEIMLCSSCLVGNSTEPKTYALEPFISKLQAELIRVAPGTHWQITTRSCFNLCPDDRISMSVNGRITLSASPDVAGVVKEALSLISG